MAILRALSLVIGTLGLMMGLLWVGQGLGLVMWPASSFMLADRSWAVAGAVLAAGSLVAIGLSRRR